MSFNTLATGMFNLYVCLVLLTMCYYLSRIYQKMYPKSKKLPDFKFIPPTPPRKVITLHTCCTTRQEHEEQEFIEQLVKGNEHYAKKVEELRERIDKLNDEGLSMMAANCKLAQDRDKEKHDAEMLLAELNKYKTPPCAPSA